MGCGKSTAASIMVDRGYRLIDSDAIIKEVILHDPAVVAFAVSRWGPSVMGGDELLDRRAVAQQIFSNDEEREIWEDEIHPRLYAIWRDRLESNPQAHWVVEVPLLFEQRLENWFDFIGCVASSPAVQLARLSKRGISHALAEQRISKQLSLARKLDLADLVLWNDGSLSFLEEQIDQVLVGLSHSPVPA